MKAWQQNIRRVEPYVPGEQPKETKVIKLNTNENPYPPAPGVQKIMQECKAERLRLYPDPAADKLVSKIAEVYGLKKEQVFVGVGSDDVLAMAFLTFFNSKKPILFPDITYSFYDVWAELFGIPYERPAVNENFRINPRDYDRENGGIVITNPNAPTSIGENLEFIEDILKHNQDVIVIVDEAYIDFGGTSALPLLEKYENLVVVQTFSKSRSLAGMRIGYAMASEELIRALNDVKYSYNSYTMNPLTIEMGAAAVADTTYFEEMLKKIVKTREKVKIELEQIGFTCLDSQTNFLFVTHDTLDASVIFEKLREQSIYVRYFKKDRIDNYLRITIGTEEEMDVFLKSVKNIIIDETIQPQ